MSTLASPLLVRLALPADADAITLLYRQLVNDASITVAPARIAAIADERHASLWVCEWHGEVRATALVSLCSDVMYRAQPFAVIENVVVDQAARQHGLGSALLHRIESYCLERDCSKMMLLSSVYREQAHRFFERAGFEASAKRGFVKYRRDFSV